MEALSDLASVPALQDVRYRNPNSWDQNKNKWLNLQGWCWAQWNLLPNTQRNQNWPRCSSQSRIHPWYPSSGYFLRLFFFSENIFINRCFLRIIGWCTAESDNGLLYGGLLLSQWQFLCRHCVPVPAPDLYQGKNTCSKSPHNKRLLRGTRIADCTNISVVS